MSQQGKSISSEHLENEVYDFTMINDESGKETLLARFLMEGDKLFIKNDSKYSDESIHRAIEKHVNRNFKYSCYLNFES